MSNPKSEAKFGVSRNNFFSKHKTVVETQIKKEKGAFGSYKNHLIIPVSIY